MIRVAINGAGRIGRAFLKIALKRKEIQVVAVNDLGNIENIAYLLKYDTAYGVSDFDISVSEDKKNLIVGGREVKYISEREPAKLPWKDIGVDVVVESTGLFTSFETARMHVEAGAKKVVISAPVKDDAPIDGATILLGINEDKFSTSVLSSTWRWNRR